MITKKQLLKKVSEETLIKNLVPAFNSNITKKNYKSIFSEKDKSPSMSIYKDVSGSYRFKSHNTGHQGDVFQMYADYWNIDSKMQFPEILRRICETMSIDIKSNNSNMQDKPYKIGHFLSYSILFLKFWKQFGVDESILRKYNIFQTKYFNLNRGDKTYSFQYEQQGIINICYIVNSRIKLYTPSLPQGFGGDLSFREQKKIFGYKDQKSQDVFGLLQLPQKPLEYILFTAGEKDCLVANAHGFNAISLQSENQLPQETLLKYLKKKAKYIIACYDNDKAGVNAAKKLLDRFGIPSIKLPEDINDIAEFFQKYDSKDFSNLLIKATRAQRITSLKEKNDGIETIFHLAESYLLNKYDFRHNVIKQRHEMSLRSENKYEILNIKALYVELRKENIKISINDLDALLNSEFCPKYNPIQHYFEGLRKWEETEEDYIAKLASYVKTNRPEEWEIALKKWLVRSIKCVFKEGYYNKHALILVQSKQNTGKSFFCRFLCPPALKDYITENIDIYDKDSRIALGTNFIINLDELKEFSNRNMSSLKSMLSSSEINVRLPYEKRAIVIKRICSFIGSTNNSQFLSDETGNVRWICFSIKDINFDYHNTRTGISEIDINDVYAQALTLYKNGFDCELSQKEIDKIEVGNENYKHVNPEMELLTEYFESVEIGKGNFLNSTKIAEYIQEKTNLRIKPVVVGKALSACNFKKSHYSKRYGYWVNIKTQ